MYEIWVNSFHTVVDTWDKVISILTRLGYDIKELIEVEQGNWWIEKNDTVATINKKI